MGGPYDWCLYKEREIWTQTDTGTSHVSDAIVVSQ